MAEQDRYLKYRRRILPDQLPRARMRYLHLLREAERLGLAGMLTDVDREFMKRSEKNGSSID